jgi:hypothetical protein
MKPGLASAALAAALLTTAAVVSAAAWAMREPPGMAERSATAETGAAKQVPAILPAN